MKANVFILSLAIVVLAATIANAYIQDSNTALSQGFTTQGVAVRTDDSIIHLGGSDGTNWVRLRVTSGGSLINVSGGTINIDQQALSTTSAAVPTTALASRFRLCVFNQDTAINGFCEDGTATSTTGAMIEPRTGRCFDTTEAIQCIAASGAPRIDYIEYAP